MTKGTKALKASVEVKLQLLNQDGPFFKISGVGRTPNGKVYASIEFDAVKVEVGKDMITLRLLWKGHEVGHLQEAITLKAGDTCTFFLNDITASSPIYLEE